MSQPLSKVHVRPSPVHGNGLFAAAAFQAGQTILTFDGAIVSTDTLSDEFISRGQWQGLAPGRCLISNDPSPFAFVNHSSHPNAEVLIETREVVALRPIEAGEEILVDYNREPMDARCRKLLGHLK